ncbi:uncharacterized protein [Physeter macrocephalus]|uniref:Uncharacterized protein isoform X2 n=1 Tax=Physeter macrocephalus TaxID=9755 RepID=A0A455BQ23_PHYMC|nr:uncharacterized protein LOC114486343 isoform X2 [Physeter catodon]|eukprot:XP_028345961.1 uncharacterized protein LOC114486343 isoform X2 [Physeter catodon]
MEERETEEVGGRSSRKNTATVSAASLPPCIGLHSLPERLVSGVGRGRGGPCSQSVPEVFCRACRDWLAVTSCCSSGWGPSRRGRLLRRESSDDGDLCCRGRYGTQAVAKGISRLFLDYFLLSLREASKRHCVPEVFKLLGRKEIQLLLLLLRPTLLLSVP